MKQEIIKPKRGVEIIRLEIGCCLNGLRVDGEAKT
jgi:hypothetical protein